METNVVWYARDPKRDFSYNLLFNLYYTSASHGEGSLGNNNKLLLSQKGRIQAQINDSSSFQGQ